MDQNLLDLLVKLPLYKKGSSNGTYGEMEYSLGVVLFHVITVQWDMLYSAALGKHQVCSERQGVDVRSGGGSHRLWRTTMVNTCRRGGGTSWKPPLVLHIWSVNTQWEALPLINSVIYSHIGLLPGPERVPGISCPFRSTHQHCPMLPWHCIGS